MYENPYYYYYLGGGGRIQDDVFESREMMDKLQKSVDALKACEKLGKDVSKVSTC